jgi:hypothetical protein
VRRRNVLVVGFGLGGLAVLVLVLFAGGSIGSLLQRPAAANLVAASPAPSSSPPGPLVSPPPGGDGPGARAGASIVYDPEDQGVLLFGGATSQLTADGHNQAITLGDTWLWNGRTWRQLAVQGPPARSAAMVVYDSVRHVVVLFGGSGPQGIGQGLYFPDTWTWDGNSWSLQQPAHTPDPMMRAGMAFDAQRGVAVMFGGEGEKTTYADTWTWDGHDWTQLAPATSPPARHFFGMAYDAARGVTVLFGGSMGAARLNDTWTWDGTNWAPAPNTPAAARGWTQLVYDDPAKAVVGYGSLAVEGHPLAEFTIVWDGTAWADRTGPSDPTPRAEVRMAYDPDTSQVVLYGPTAETWTWDGRAWSSWSPSTGS